MGGKRVVPMNTPRIERFLDKIEINPWGLGCWIWTAKTGGTKSTAGQFWNGSRYVYAHRYIWEYVNGPIPEGMEIDHLCRHPLCVNPLHLEPVTPEENSRRARKSICNKGHDLTNPENQRFDEKGRRRGCMICRRLSYKAKYIRNKNK